MIEREKAKSLKFRIHKSKNPINLEKILKEFI